MYPSKPIWTDINRPPAQYPWLDEDVECEVCVIGGGVTGAMAAARLAEAGINTLLITDQRIGSGSTDCAMPSSEYDGGHTMRALVRLTGEEAAAALMFQGIESIEQIAGLAEKTGNSFGFSRRDVMLFTDDPAELSILNREYLARRREGFDCAYISRQSAADIFPFDVAGAIVSKGMACEADPYLLTHACISLAKEHGARIYENTSADEIDTEEGVLITTSTNHQILADKVIIAAGASCAPLLGDLTRPRTGFFVAGGDAELSESWPGRCVLRTWSKPGITVAAAPNGMVCAGGLSTGVVDESGKLGGILPIPKLIEKRLSALWAGACYLLPELSGEACEHATVSRYYETADYLPIVGEAEPGSGCIFAMPSGASGVLQSEICARLAVGIATASDDMVDAAMFSPARKSLVR